MGIAAYLRGNKVISWQIDRELAEKQSRPAPAAFMHSYVDFRNGETVYMVCDQVGLLYQTISERDARAALALATRT